MTKQNTTSFGPFLKSFRDHGMEDMEKNDDISYAKEFNMGDIEYFKTILNSAQRIGVHITWDFDEQQADAFHHGFRSEEFVRRLKRLVNGNPRE